MLLGVMLLYVGAVLVVNGIWLLGQARAAERKPEVAPLDPATPGTAARIPSPQASEAHPAFIQNREVAVLNVFTGFVGLVTAVTLIVQGNRDGDLSVIRGGGFILLFAFTYLWVAYNAYVNAGGHAFGWYCLFVAITAVGAGAYTIDQAGGDDASIWLGIDWFAWAVLWGMFWALLTLERPIARITGWVATLEGIATSWVFGFLLLEGTIAFGT
jgi:hypothetical protein